MQRYQIGPPTRLFAGATLEPPGVVNKEVEPEPYVSKIKTNVRQLKTHTADELAELQKESDELVRRIVDNDNSDSTIDQINDDLEAFVGKTDDVEILGNLAEAAQIWENQMAEAEEDEERRKGEKKGNNAVQAEADAWPDINSAPKLDFKENYYSILECDATSKPRALKKAFYKMVKLYHPDSHPNDEEKKALCIKQMMVINQAYATVTDATLRAEYDKKNRRPYRAKSKSSGGGFGAPNVRQ